MRVVYYVNGWPPGRVANGIVSAVGALAPALRSLGHEATILAHRVAGDYSDPSVVVLDERVPFRQEFGPLQMVRNHLSPGRDFYDTPQRLAKALASLPHDIFEIEESFGWSAHVARKSAAPVVTRLHGPWFINGRAARGDAPLEAADERRIRQEGAAVAAAEFVSSPSRYVLDAVRNHYGIPLASAVVIPNPVAATPEDLAWRADRADANEVLFVGRFDLRKGGDIVLRAFSIAARRRPGLKLTFVGPNDQPIQEGGRVRGLAEFLADELSPEAARRVTVTGPLPHLEIARLRQRAFVTAMASRGENFPCALLEAMAAGAPVVSTSVGGIEEIVRDDEEALLTPTGDAEALAAGLLALLENPRRAERLGQNARRRALSEYAPDAVARLSLAYYEEIAARRRKAR